MTRYKSRISYDLTMSLTYPSVLGAVIYFFFDSSIQVLILPFLNNAAIYLNSQTTRIITPEYHFFESFGLPKFIGFIAFLIITLLVIIHHSIDYMYSKYSEGYYDFLHFIMDVIISIFLAIAYIFLSAGSSSNIQHIKVSFAIFWLCLIFTYLIFICWDRRAYLEFRNIDDDLAKFFQGMVIPFELSGIISFSILFLVVFLIQEISWMTYIYILLSIVIFGVFSIWFCKKVYLLEKITNGDDSVLPGRSVRIKSGGIMVIKEADIANISDCARIFVDAYREVYGEPWTIDSATARLSEFYQNAPEYCFTLEIGGIIVGFIFARPFSWHNGMRVWIEELVIDKQYRGRGLGRTLLNTFLQTCKDRGIHGVSLISEVESRAHKIYRSMGLRPSDWVHLEADLDKLL